MMRTHIKICGLRREVDVDAAVTAGADALGFVFYPPSPRYVSPEIAVHLAARVPPFVCRVGLFVNPDAAEVQRVLAAVPLEVLQFHGNESSEFCHSFAKPYIKALAVGGDRAITELATAYTASAQGLLLDTPSAGWGGSGRAFDWRLVPPSLARPIILSGGLTTENVEEAICCVRPWAVDVSSGVESSLGIKDAAKIHRFCAAVRDADARNTR